MTTDIDTLRRNMERGFSSFNEGLEKQKHALEQHERMIVANTNAIKSSDRKYDNFYAGVYGGVNVEKSLASAVARQLVVIEAMQKTIDGLKKRGDREDVLQFLTIIATVFNTAGLIFIVLELAR